jgi:dipeptidyl-peptidase-4
MTGAAGGPARRRRVIAGIAAAATLAASAGARGAGPDENFLEEYAATSGFRLGQPQQVEFTPDGAALLFLQSAPRSFAQDLYEHDVQSGQTRLLLGTGQLLAGTAEELSAEELARRERARSTARGIAAFEQSEDGRILLVPLGGRLFLLERASGRVTELPAAGGPAIDPRLSPDGRLVATVRAGDLYVIDIARGSQRRLTRDASATLANGVAEFVAQEEMQRRRGFWWSPDSRSLVFQQTDESAVETLYIGDPADPGKPPQPWRYPRAGRDNARVRLFEVGVGGGKPREIGWDHQRYPYLAAVRWERHAPLTLLVQDREQQREQLLAVDEHNRAPRELLTETDSAWLNLDPSVPRWLADGQSFLWSTERNGAWQLERRARDGTLAATLTDTGFGYRRLLEADAGCAYVVASADPTQAQVWCVPLDPRAGPPRALAKEPGLSSGVFARTRSLWLHQHTPRSGPPRQVLRELEGRERAVLPSRAAPLPFDPAVEFVETATTPAFHAALTRPRDFDPQRRYPVILHVYGGPHAQMVNAAGSRYLLEQWMADHGAIVVSLDGRGTPARGREWERAIRGDFISQPLADQVAGLRALGARYPELDLERVGVFGWSFGGYFSAMAAMRAGDFFDVAVAGAPVVDWHYYDTHYTERYLGLPTVMPEAYRRSSVLEYAEQLQRPLLLIHGTADDNVYFLHSAKLAERLFQAGVPFDFLPLVGRTHMVADPPSTRRLHAEIMRYLMQHLRER